MCFGVVQLIFSGQCGKQERALIAKEIRSIACNERSSYLTTASPVKSALHLKHNSATAQGSVPRRTQGPPSSNSPNIDEARRIKSGPPKAPNPVPSTKRRHRDAACKRARGEAPINQPQSADGNNDELVARVDNDPSGPTRRVARP